MDLNILNWVMEHFGALNSVVFMAAAYTAYLHQIEVREHKTSREYTRQIQEKFIETQVANIRVLNDLNNTLRGVEKLKS